MNRGTVLTIAALVALAAVTGLLLTPAAHAQDSTLYTFSILGGIGGSLDDDEDAGFDNSVFEAGFSVEAREQLLVGGRVGSFEFDDNDTFGTVTRPALDYVHLGGEYRFTEAVYESGVYLGLGYFQFEGTGVIPGDAETPPVFVNRDEEALGLVLGLTGEFEASRRVGVLVELTTYITALDVSSFFATARAGLAIHF